VEGSLSRLAVGPKAVPVQPFGARSVRPHTTRQRAQCVVLRGVLGLVLQQVFAAEEHEGRACIVPQGPPALR